MIYLVSAIYLRHNIRAHVFITHIEETHTSTHSTQYTTRSTHRYLAFTEDEFDAQSFCTRLQIQYASALFNFTPHIQNIQYTHKHTQRTCFTSPSPGVSAGQKVNSTRVNLRSFCTRLQIQYASAFFNFTMKCVPEESTRALDYYEYVWHLCVLLRTSLFVCFDLCVSAYFLIIFVKLTRWQAARTRSDLNRVEEARAAGLCTLLGRLLSSLSLSNQLSN